MAICSSNLLTSSYAFVLAPYILSLFTFLKQNFKDVAVAIRIMDEH